MLRSVTKEYHKNTVLQSLYILTFFLILLASSCKTHKNIGNTSSYIYKVETSVDNQQVAFAAPTGDQEIEDMIAPYKERLDNVMNEVIGELEVSLTKESPESDIGNWLSDMMYAETKSLNEGVLDFAIQNQGGVRVSSLSAGPITRGEIFEIMPFDNMIVILSASGAQTRLFLDHIAEGKGWPISKELSFKIKDKKAVDVLIGGQPLDDERIYHFAIPDYIANGGSGSDMLQHLKRKDLNLLLRNTFIEHIKKDTERGIQQSATKEGRIINLDHE